MASINWPSVSLPLDWWAPHFVLQEMFAFFLSGQLMPANHFPMAEAEKEGRLTWT